LFVVYSGADIGTTFPVKAATATDRAHPFPNLTLTRGARRLRFFQGRRALVTMRGDLRHTDLWLVDLETGKECQLISRGANEATRGEATDFTARSPDERWS